MPLGVRKLIEPFWQRYLAQQRKAGEGKKPTKDAAKAEIAQTANPEGQVIAGTKDLAEAKEPSRQLSGTINSSGDSKGEVLVKDAPAQPPPPKIELSLQTMKISPEAKGEALLEGALAQPAQPEGKPPGEEKSLSNLSGKSDEGEDKRKNEEASDLVSKLFSRQEEEQNPLMGLVASLPNVTVKELLDEAQEIKAMLGEWQQN